MSPHRSKRTKQQVVPEKEKPNLTARRKKPVQSFKTYLYVVQNQVHPSMRISSRAMNVMNTFMFDMFERIATEASRLVTFGKKQTLTSKDIETAVKLLLPGELSKHAISEGTKAVHKYNRSKFKEDQ
ncbi:late histone H2B.L4-like [Andrena cerasifolii]|uniref:late histone H2B.L4-like n=1 Tax=Andrena cerasifolii TaxID=2819439 RepID=UPI0040382820